MINKISNGMNKKILCFSTLVFSFMLLASVAQASTTATLALTNTTGDNVRVDVTGEPSSSIKLSFLPSGASSITTITFGTTNSSGNFSSTISSGGYGIPQGSPVYVAVNGVQSSTMLWPSYTSSLTLSSTSVSVAVGQSLAVTGSNSLILAANSMTSVIGAVLSGSQITITGLSSGSGSLAVCGANVGCKSIAVTVGDQGQSQVSFSQNNFTLNDSQTKTIDIYGGSSAGFTISSNSNTSAVTASISGSSKFITVYGNHTPGTATIVVCSKDSSTNCANLNVTTLSSTVDALSFSPSSITLNPGVTQNVIVSGGVDNNYYISSNSNSGVVSAAISSNILTLVGGSNAGTSVVVVCSTTVNATCGSLNITLNLNSSSASATTIAFSQNVVSIAKNDSANVTVTGGTGTGYVISSNSNATAVTANVTGTSNIIAIYGAGVGSSIVTVCSATSGSVCASIYVTVSEEMLPIYFSQNNVAITPGNTLIISVTGGSGTGKVISLNSNSNAVSAALNNNGGILTLSGGKVSGTAAITVCSATYSTNCATLNATFTAASTSSNSSSSNAATSFAAVVQALIDKILSEASDVIHENGITIDATLENKIKNSYVNSLIKGDTVNAAVIKLITNFITYGTATTKNMGTGERAGVLGSYKKAFSKLPTTESEWADAIKIANGRWPGEVSSSAIALAKVEFKKVYKRDANLSNQNDNAAISIIAYGLRSITRNINSEKSAITTFKSIYGHNPITSLAWDIVRSIAYSGAKR